MQALQPEVWAPTGELKENEHFELGFGKQEMKQAITMGNSVDPIN